LLKKIVKITERWGSAPDPIASGGCFSPRLPATD